MSVNLSALQLEDPELVPSVRGVLANSGIDPACLKLEITESMIMQRVHEAVRVPNELKTLGLRLSIDDFGTGYSSLSYLHRLPADTLKVDRSFVKAMPQSTENREMVRIIIDLARALHMDVVAEGIETIEDVTALAALECDYGQGFHFSRPVTATAATALVAGPLPWQVKQRMPVI